MHKNNKTRKVLIVDNDQDLIRGLKLRFDARGYQTIVADGFESGLQTAITQKPHAIVMDVRMRDGCGLEALSILKNNSETKHIPIVILSGSVGSEQEALDDGARFFIRKPYRGQQVLDAVRSAIIESTLEQPIA